MDCKIYNKIAYALEEHFRKPEFDLFSSICPVFCKSIFSKAYFFSTFHPNFLHIIILRANPFISIFFPFGYLFLSFFTSYIDNEL